MTRYLGIDYGSKRIGLAFASDDVDFASPVTMLETRGNMPSQVAAVASVASDYDVDTYVVGLPLNMDGTAGPQAEKTRRFGDALSRTTGQTVHYFDERLSTKAAEDMLRPADLTRKKLRAVRDAVAAQVILQGYMDARRQTPGDKA